MKFIFECSTRYLTSERSERVHEISRLNPRRSISYLQAPIYYSIYIYKCSSILSKGEYSKGHIRTHVFDTISEHMCSDTTFLSGQNPYNTVVYIIKEVISNYLGGPPSNLNGRRGILTEWNGFQMNFNMSDNWQTR